MKAIVIDKFVENYDDIRVSNVPKPVPRHDEILIQVKAAGVNFVDTLYARGKHQNNKRHMKPPFTLGLEFSGVIISCPSLPSHDATTTTTGPVLRPGDLVLGDYSGSYAEYITYPASLASSSLHRVPEGWTFAEAAGLAATLPVSYAALDVAFGGSLQGTGGRQQQHGGAKTVLVHAAAGGLGLAAVQIATALGHRVIGTAGSAEKCRIAEGFGAVACVNYNDHKQWWDKVLDLTEERKGVDVVFDSVGLVDSSLKCIAHRGTVMIVGFAGRDGNSIEAVKMNKVLLKQVSLMGYRYGESLRRYPHEKAKIWDALWPLIHSGKIRPYVFNDNENSNSNSDSNDRGRYPGLESVPAALKDIAGRKVWGKAVIQVEDAEGSEEMAPGEVQNRKMETNMSGLKGKSRSEKSKL